MAHFSHLARRPAVDIHFNDIYFSAGDKEIICGISGGFKAGQLSAILGPSGAGKSTLMNIIAGYMTSGVKGCIYTNGQPRRVKMFNKLSSYIMQEDELEPYLTVREAMHLSARLKLGDELSDSDKLSAVEEILSTLGLSKCGDNFTDQLSGGQRKRVSIALELVNNPPVLFLDEPTSGLDIVSMNQCLDMMRVLAHQGRTIVCTIHQPSSSVFQMFDSVYIMVKGRCIFQGAPDQLVPYLTSAALYCPPTHNPADFVFEVMNDETTATLSEMIQNGRVNKVNNRHKTFQTQSSLLYGKDSFEELPPVLDPNTNLDFPTSSWTQFKILLALMMTQKFRNKAGFRLQIFHHLSSAIMVGFTFYGVGNNASRPVENFKFCVCLCVFYMYTHCMTPVIHYPYDIKIMKREFFNRWYGLKAYFAAKSLSTIPSIIILGWFYAVLTYVITDQPLELKRWAWLMLVSTMIIVTSESLGTAIGVTFNATNGTLICSAVMSPILILAIQGMGYGQSISTALTWLMKLSYIRYAVVCIIYALYLDDRVMECEQEDIYCFYKDPKLLVRDLGMQGGKPQEHIFGLVFYFFFFRILAYVALRCRVTTGFSHQVSSYVNKIVKYK